MDLPILEHNQRSELNRSSRSIELFVSAQLRVLYDRQLRGVWLRWNPKPRPCFNPTLLNELLLVCDFLRRGGGTLVHAGEELPIELMVMASDCPGVFNLGGDLELFTRLIAARDRDGLINYGRACIDVWYSNYSNFGLRINTFSLVQGDCMGGGFEGALSGDYIIAERQAKFGFPEIHFNLFPGMGAYSALKRRVGQKITEQLISEGKTYSASEMLELGLVDAVTEVGQGEACLAQYLKERQRSRNGMTGVCQVRRRVEQLQYDELLDIVVLWADTALQLTPRNLKLMQRLMVRQST